MTTVRTMDARIQLWKFFCTFIFARVTGYTSYWHSSKRRQITLTLHVRELNSIWWSRGANGGVTGKEALKPVTTVQDCGSTSRKTISSRVCGDSDWIPLTRPHGISSHVFFSNLSGYFKSKHDIFRVSTTSFNIFMVCRNVHRPHLLWGLGRRTLNTLKVLDVRILDENIQKCTKIVNLMWKNNCFDLTSTCCGAEISTEVSMLTS